WIDFDPGGWWGSPTSDFVNLFTENRKLLRRYHERPAEATLFYFMDDGWGTGSPEQNFREALHGIIEKVLVLGLFCPEISLILMQPCNSSRMGFELWPTAFS